MNTFLKLNIKKLGKGKMITFADGSKGIVNTYEKSTIRVPIYYIAAYLKKEIEFDTELTKNDKKLVKEWAERVSKKYMSFENYTFNEGVNRILFQSLMLQDKNWIGHNMKIHKGLKYWK